MRGKGNLSAINGGTLSCMMVKLIATHSSKLYHKTDLDYQPVTNNSSIRFLL